MRLQQWRDAETTEMRRLVPHSPNRSLDDEEDISYRSQQSTHPDDTNQCGAYDPSKTKRRLQGWRFGAVTCAISASAVFIINFVVTIWGSVHNKSKGSVLYEGNCKKAHQLDTGLHLLLNLLSTLLLSSSNYCMQCLSAPTRKELDEAHARGMWLDIGIPSIRNLMQINPRRTVLWLLLGFSSLPLHLFYNSAVFSSTSSNDYYAFSVSQSFIDNPECFNCDKISGQYVSHLEEPIRMMHAKARNKILDTLPNAECISEYAKMIQSERRNVLLVADDSKYPPANASTIGATNVYAVGKFNASDAEFPWQALGSYGWICSDLRTWDATTTCASLLGQIENAPDAWKVGTTAGIGYVTVGPTYGVQYCLSEKTEPRCKLQFILPIMVLVTILNLLKAILIFYVPLGMKEEPLMTMGDAVASFLEREDPTTKGMCLLSVDDAKKHKGYFPAGPKEWTVKKHQWKDVTSLTRRAVTILLSTAILIVVASLFVLGIIKMPPGQSRSLAALARFGYGAVNPITTIAFHSKKSTIQNILIANSAQLILSFLYFAYNGLFTCMLLGYEWYSYAHQRKGLRVSRAPIGAQRSTYFLQLPYRFALPLMALSGVLHWLVSQSIFLVAINAKSWNGIERTSWTSCGYSPMAILSVLCLGSFMTIAIVGFGFVTFKPGMVLVGSCSAAISAACHNATCDSVDGNSAAAGKLKWGAVGKNSENVGHCTFSTEEVDLPSEGEIYAG
ncbi:hypothetical protein K505DRAFT_310397 [Melanomma pulvis-pyrius CBS 109.77]|uniref:DUF6536 domain-containing protein n=1 Tax=Melanomma pulvis-pyrius CBS 109.77 TaxID=1314802 RepID=A0A6A6X399_9PLEO|nr:hypothetical protein K505DRAFT_310397 [Melanomma pulvis-pyrius CBS 109.77]